MYTTYTLHKAIYMHTAKNAPLLERVPLNAGVSNAINSSHNGAKVATVLLMMPALKGDDAADEKEPAAYPNHENICASTHSDSTLNRDRKEKMQDIKMREHNQIDIIYTNFLQCVSSVFMCALPFFTVRACPHRLPALYSCTVIVRTHVRQYKT